jgi:ribose-phosphate pyrophosphokinase
VTSPAPRIHSFADTAPFARALARAAGVRCLPVRLHRFPDGESLVRVATPPGAHAVLVRTLHDPNAKLVETLLAADALRRAGARRVTLVAPYLPYMRQDAVFHAGEPVSQQVVGDALGRTFDRVLTVEAHLHRVSRLADVVRGHGRSLSAAPAVGAWLRTIGADVVVGPDVESAAFAGAVGRAAAVGVAVGRKVRLGDDRVRLALPGLAGARHAVIVDDIAASGGTLAATARALRRAGVARVDACVVHAVFAPGALARIRAAGVRRIVSCDTVPHATNAIRVAALVAGSLR